MRIFFAADIAPPEAQAWLEALQTACPGHQWLSPPEPGLAGLQPVQADVAVVANPPAGVLAQVQGLRLIQSLWAGVDRLLADRTVPDGPPLARMVDPMMTAAMVQSALWAVTALHRGFFHYAQQQRAARWQQSPQRRASDVRVLVLGLGTMGAAVAAALAAQGYGVTGWRRQPVDGGDGPDSVGQAPPGVSVLCGSLGLAEGLGGADVVVNLLPLTSHTRGIVNASFLSKLKVGAALVNFGRGAHVVEADLLQALDAGRLSHAVLDVFATEPLPPEHAFWHHPRVTVLPHVAALTDLRSAADVVADNLARLHAGRPLRHLVDRQRGY